MNEWRTELDALVAQTTAFVDSQTRDAVRPHPQPSGVVERKGLEPLDYGGSERDEIRKRVETFKAHQQRFIQEREQYAAFILRQIKPTTKP